jgi:hypothetical protein
MPRLAVVPELEAELDRLYGLPLDEFTPARNELATRLKNAGQDDASRTVKALKKPSVPVWAANQLARRNPADVEALVDAGAQLRAAQEAALRGGSPEDVRAATRAERDALRTLTRHATGVLDDAGRPASQQTLERISSTLRAAAVNPDAADLLRIGRLPDEVQAEGFSALAAMAPATPAKRGRRTANNDTVDLAARREHELALRRLRREAEEAERAAVEAEQESEEAARNAAEARERAKAARRDAREAAKALAAEERHE